MTLKPVDSWMAIIQWYFRHVMSFNDRKHDCQIYEIATKDLLSQGSWLAQGLNWPRHFESSEKHFD